MEVLFLRLVCKLLWAVESRGFHHSVTLILSFDLVVIALPDQFRYVVMGRSPIPFVQPYIPIHLLSILDVRKPLSNVIVTVFSYDRKQPVGVLSLTNLKKTPFLSFLLPTATSCSPNFLVLTIS